MDGKNERKKKNRRIGRPPKITPAVLDKLTYAYSIGCTDVEACAYADISLSCLYKYLDGHTDYKERRDILKKKPVLQAKQNIVDLLEQGDGVTTRWYLEKKCGDEFNSRAEVEVNTGGTLSIESRSDALNAFLSNFLN